MFRQYRKIQEGEFIVVFGDGASGGPDYCACSFMSVTKMDFPLLYHKRGLTNEMTNAIYPVLERIFDVTKVKPVIAYERNFGGVFELERLAALNRQGKYEIFKMPNYGREDNPESVRLGWDTNTSTRPKMLQDWKEAKVYRENYTRLYFRLLQDIGKAVVKDGIVMIAVESIVKDKLPPIESVTRTRRIVKEEHPDLKGSKKYEEQCELLADEARVTKGRSVINY